jgi:hypothetical protein
MRQRAVTPSTSAVLALVAAIPTEALRGLLLSLILDGTGAGAPQAEPPASALQPAAKRRCGWPKGRPRRPAIAKANVAVAAYETPDPKLAARHRHNASRRAKRAAEKQAKSGNGSAEPTPSARALWQHAETLQPKTPWRAVARALELNDAVCLDAYRSGHLPPGVAASAIERFLELPTT